MSQTVAIAGCGRMGRERARTARLYGALVGHVFDTDLDRAQAFAAEWGGVVASDPSELLSENPAALFLCTPPDSRQRLEAAAIEQRVPWLAEKPLGVDRTAPERILDRLSAAPVIAAAGYMNRYRSGVRHAKKLLSQAEVIGISLHWLCGRYRVPWWGQERSSGGPINEQATHFVDLARHLAGNPQEVTAQGSGGSSPTSAAIALAFEGGFHGTVLYSCEAPEKHIGAIVLTNQGRLRFAGWDLRLVENTIDGWTHPEGFEEDIFLIETTAFLEAVRLGNPDGLACTYGEGVGTQRLVDAVRDSINAP